MMCSRMPRDFIPRLGHPHHDGWEELDHPVVVISYDEWNRLHNAIAEPIRNAPMNDAGVGLDRHELAHAVLDEFRARDSDPPFLLHEGWADSQSGLDAGALAWNALDLRAEPDGPAPGPRRSGPVPSHDEPRLLRAWRRVRRFPDPQVWRGAVPAAL